MAQPDGSGHSRRRFYVVRSACTSREAGSIRGRLFLKSSIFSKMWGNVGQVSYMPYNHFAPRIIEKIRRVAQIICGLDT